MSDFYYWLDQDEQSAVTMLKKHQIMEQAVEDYAEAVHLLSKTSRGLVGDGHPERFGRTISHIKSQERLEMIVNHHQEPSCDLTTIFLHQ